MLKLFTPTTLAGLLAMLLTAMCSPHAQGLDRAPEDVLKAKGLTKVGYRYLLDADAALADWLRNVRAAEKKVDDSIRRRSNLERDLTSALTTFENLADEWDTENAKLNRMSKDAYASYNVQVRKVNAIRDRLLEGQAYIKKKQAILGEIGDPSDEYVAIVLKFGAAIDATVEKYQALAADIEITAAIDKINKAGKTKLTLGPSDRLTTELPEIRKLRDKVNTDTIKFEFEGGVPTVPVTINGNVVVGAVVDSGAAKVTISDKTAKELKLVPGKNDKTTHMVTADGTVTEVHVMMLKSVRLGKFTVENVECIVQPPSSKDSITLLGGSFLRRFVYKMDLGAGQLKLSQVSDKTTIVDVTPVAPATGSGTVLKATAPLSNTPSSTGSPPSPPTAVAPSLTKPTVVPPLSALAPGLRMEYFDDENFDRRVGEQLQTRIAADWGQGAVGPGVAVDYFTVRYSGYLRAPESGRYRIYIDTDDGGRIWINGTNYWDHWGSAGNTIFEVDLSPTPQPFVMDVTEKEGSSHATLAWGKKGAKGPLYLIPPSGFLVEANFAKAHALSPGHGLMRTIFRDRKFENSPVTDIDSNIDSRFGRNAPIDGMSNEQFSIRWTGFLVAPEPGDYRLIANVDDGMHLWLDGREIITQEKTGGFREMAAVTLDTEPHEFRLDYFQDGGDGTISLHWEKLGGFVEHPIPASAFYVTRETALKGRALAASTRPTAPSHAIADATNKRLAEIKEYRRRVGETENGTGIPLDVTGPIEGDATWPAVGPQTLSHDIIVGYNDGNHGKDHKPFDGHLVIEPGFMLEGGKLAASRGLLELRGEPGRPIILKNVFIGCELTGRVKASNVIFEDCKFQKTGGWFFQWFSSKWELSDCVMIRSNFNKLDRGDYGLKLDRCTFISCRFPSRLNKPGKDDDSVKMATSEWGHIADCDFFGCNLMNSSLWMLQRCNLYGCSVTSIATYQSADDFVVEAGLLAEEREKLPADAAAMIRSSKAGHITFKAATGVFETKAFPSLASAPATPPVYAAAPTAPRPSPQTTSTPPTTAPAKRGTSSFDVP